MKKLLRSALVCAMMLCSSWASAETTVGNTDFSSAWWTAFSDYYTLEPNKTLTLEFTNYSDELENFHNWVAIVTTAADRGAEGYSEYFAIRADNYGWGDNWDASNLTSNFNWDTFRSDMNGSNVKLTVSRIGKQVTVHADITKGDKTYFENFYTNCGDGTQDINVFLTVEKSYIVINDRATTITDNQQQEVEGELVGNLDNSTNWWTAFSPYYILAPGQSVNIKFFNYTDQQEIFHNWVLGVTNNAPRVGAGYKEYFFMRADDWGWGDYWNTDNYQSDINSDDFFTEIMNGAEVDLTISREGATINVVATIDGDVYTKTYSVECGDGEQDIRVFLTTEKGHIIITDSQISGELPTGLVGNIDYSSAWWTAFSDYYTIQPNYTLSMTFKNLSLQDEVWHNFVAVLTNDAARGESDYTEYCVLRADAYGWASLYETGTFTHNYPTTTNEEGNTVIDLKTLMRLINGAKVSMKVIRDGAKVTTSFDILGTDGNSYNETFTLPECGDGTQDIRTFLTCENSYIVIDESSISLTTTASNNDPTAISEIATTNADQKLYNLQGQRVGKAQHGIYIQNGKKFVK